jgi:hypothetical protein
MSLISDGDASIIHMYVACPHLIPSVYGLSPWWRPRLLWGKDSRILSTLLIVVNCGWPAFACCDTVATAMRSESLGPLCKL